VLVVHELATNSVRHAGGAGALRFWEEPGGLYCEVRDRGRISDPLAGRFRPQGDVSGYGLWLVNQLADLVQMRSSAAGTVVRARVARA
jgi:anti-sigma regulatory factor (Ser/Thr protein kinase)